MTAEQATFPQFGELPSTRSSRYREQLTRAWAFLRERARSEAEAAALDAELERALAEGPRYHRGSEFIDVPRINCDRNFLAKVLFIARAIERGTYKVRAKGKHGGVLGRSALAVFEVLINIARARQGRVAPGYEALAAIARMSRQTVITAISVLELMGLVTVIRRIKRVRTALGFKTVQATNAFDIHPPELAGPRRADARRPGRPGLVNLGGLAAAMFARSESNRFAAPKGNIAQARETTEKGGVVEARPPLEKRTHGLPIGSA
jgi:hypothetical protein